MKGWRGMGSTSACTRAKGDGKVKIIKRGLGNDAWGWRGFGGMGG